MIQDAAVPCTVAKPAERVARRRVRSMRHVRRCDAANEAHEQIALPASDGCTAVAHLAAVTDGRAAAGSRNQATRLEGSAAAFEGSRVAEQDIEGEDGAVRVQLF